MRKLILSSLFLIVTVREYRCLAHIINLATQALILTRSKAKFYSADAEDAHVPETAGVERDELGLVRAICVKVIPFQESFVLTDVKAGTIILTTQGTV